MLLVPLSRLPFPFDVYLGAADCRGRAMRRVLTSGLPRFERQYSYDLDSNRSQIQNYTTSGCNGTPTTTTYTYTYTASAGVDEVTNIGSTNYTYTSDGQTASQGTTSYTWDGWSRLQTATVGSNTVTYTYDPTSALTTRTSSNPSTTLNYLLGDLFETNASGTTTTSYTDGAAGNLASYNGPPTSTSTPTYLFGVIKIKPDKRIRRCVMTTFDPDTIEQDQTVLTHVVGALQGELALDAEALNNGWLEVGDPVRLQPLVAPCVKRD